MPRQRSRLTRSEKNEHQSRLSRLQEMGLAVGLANAVLQQTPQLRLEQTDLSSARIYSFVAEGFVFVTPLGLILRASHLFPGGFEMTAPWDPFPLELEEPQRFPLYEKLMLDYPPEPNILNSYLIGERGLSRQRTEGLLIARGKTSPPSQFRDGAILCLELSLWDESGAELNYVFQGSLDRGFYSRAQEALRKNTKPRVSIFPKSSYQDLEQSILADPTRKNKV